MNKENAHLFLPLVQALMDGKKLQFKNSDHDGEWWEDFRDDEVITFDDPSDYRIKPEPRTFEMWLGPTGSMYPVSLYPNTIGCIRITVQEVLE